jgi:hypothetical protein
VIVLSLVIKSWCPCWEPIAFAPLLSSHPHQSLLHPRSPIISVQNVALYTELDFIVNREEAKQKTKKKRTRQEDRQQDERKAEKGREEKNRRKGNERNNAPQWHRIGKFSVSSPLVTLSVNVRIWGSAHRTPLHKAQSKYSTKFQLDRQQGFRLPTSWDLCHPKLPEIRPLQIATQL